jgi:hypothetical protein
MHIRLGISGPLCAWLAALALTGCESPSWTHALNESFNAKAEGGPQTEEQHRREYIANHNRKSMRWLLAYRVRPGMSYDQVRHILGEEGELETNRSLKTGGVNVRVDDDVYAFGPDSEGRSLKLFFREDRLINFNPEDFQ